MTIRHPASYHTTCRFLRRALLVAPLIVAVCAARALDRTGPATYALVVGIGDYDEYGDEPGGDLPGAVNDARAFRDVLVGRLGVPATNIHVLLDGAARREDIEREFTRWLPSVVREGDVVWVYYAGHGSQTWDQDFDEADGMDETICPADAAKATSEFDILDDDVDRWVSALSGATVFLVWDKCHAESSMRNSVPLARSRVLGRDVRNLPRPTGYRAPRELRSARAIGGRAQTSEEWRADAAASDASDEGPVLVEIAASQADQVAMDVAWPPEGDEAPRFGGAFTTNFVRNLWQAPGSATLEQVFRRTANDLRAQRFEQQPELTDARGLRALPLSSLAQGGADPSSAAPTAPTAQAAPASVARLPITAIRHPHAVLGAGSDAGITVGSLYEIDSRVLRIVDVSSAQSTAELVYSDGNAAGLPVIGAQATLVAYRFPSARLRVSVAELAPSSVAAIERTVGDWPAIELVRTAQEFAHLVVRADGDDFVVLGGDGFPRHRIDDADGSRNLQRLRDALLGESRAHQLSVLDNPAQPFPVRFSIDGTDDDLELGEEVRIRVRSGRAGYLTLIDLPADGTVTVVFPTEPWQDSRIPAGVEFVLPRLSDPAIVVAPPLGRSTVRAFVTARPLELDLGMGDSRLADHIIESLRRVAGDSRVASEALPIATWSSAAIVYDVVE
ncbi:MAG TPA: caspase family protein [Thermoanaerobaculia bacterium]